jgi:hypothetical protein
MTNVEDWVWILVSEVTPHVDRNGAVDSVDVARCR